MGEMAASNLAMALFMAAFAFLASSQAQESITIFPAIFSFGDSTVDVGNNNYRKAAFKANYPPYGRDFINHRPTGRFCNGKLPTDITAEAMGFKNYTPPYLSREASGKNLLYGANFASAGAAFDEKANTYFGAITLSQQLKLYKEYQLKLVRVAGKKRTALIIRDGLYLLSAGSGDFVQNYYVNSSINKMYTVDQYSTLLMGSFSSFIETLYHSGARKIGVTSLPPLGCFPALLSFFKYSQKGCIPRVTKDVQGFNAKLNTTAVSLQKQLPGLRLVVFDIFTPIYDVIQSPSNYGFDEVRRSCCNSGNRGPLVLCNPKFSRACPNATKYVFWDSVHPSATANQIIAQSLIIQGTALL